MARLALWLGRRMDTEGTLLAWGQPYRSPRRRVGWWLERTGWLLVNWGWARGAR